MKSERKRHCDVTKDAGGNATWKRSSARLFIYFWIIMTAVQGLVPSLVPAEGPAVAKRYTKDALAHMGLADRYAEEGEHFLAVKEYRQAIALGLDTSDVRLKLSLALYGLGLVDEAITEISKAQRLFPDANYLHLPTGILYLAGIGGDLERAEQHFIKALQINPGFGDAYYYLGEVYFRKGDYQRAWLCCRMAKTLSHPGDGLRRKLEAVATAPEVTPWREEPNILHLRMISVSTREEAQTLLDRMAAGELFEHIAEERGSEANQGSGGYAGALSPADLEPEIAQTLLAQDEFATPLALQAQKGYQLVQRIAPFDPAYWDQLLATSGKGVAVAVVARPVVPTAVPKAVPKAAVPSPETSLPAAAGEAVPPRQTVTPPIPPSPPAEPATYYRLHAGSFDTESTARKRMEKLETYGFPSYLFEQETAAGSYHVVAGRYPSRQEAMTAAAELERLKIDYFVGVAKGRYKELPPAVAKATPVAAAEPTLLAKPPEPEPGKPSGPASAVAVAARPVEPAPVPAAVAKAPEPAPKAPAPATKAENKESPPPVAKPTPIAATVSIIRPEQPEPLPGTPTNSTPPEAVATLPIKPTPGPEAVAKAAEPAPKAPSPAAKAENKESPPPVAKPTPVAAAERTLQAKPPEPAPGKPSGPVAPVAVAAPPVVSVPLPKAVAKAEEPAPKAPSPTATAEAAPVKQTVAPPKPLSSSVEPAVYYLLHAGSFNIEANAIIRNEALRKHGIDSYIFRKETAFGIYHVVAGKYASRQEAQDAAAQLAALGFEFYISERRQRH
jgi:tetratricopeptide (TPR) repeat protein